MSTIILVDGAAPNPNANLTNFLCIHVNRVDDSCYVAQSAVVTPACINRSIEAIAKSGLKIIHIDADYPKFKTEWVGNLSYLLANIDEEAQAFVYTTNTEFKNQLAERLIGL